MDDVLLSATEACKQLNICKKTLYRWIWTKKIEATKPSSDQVGFRIPLAAVEQAKRECIGRSRGFGNLMNQSKANDQAVGMREAIFKVLTSRFGLVPQEIKGRLDQLDTLEALDIVLKGAATAPALEDFKRLLI